MSSSHKLDEEDLLQLRADEFAHRWVELYASEEAKVFLCRALESWRRPHWLWRVSVLKINHCNAAVLLTGCPWTHGTKAVQACACA
jgi:hypothetical protein